MAKLSPFLTGPSEWVEKLAGLKAEIGKLEDRAESLKEKIKLHLSEKGLDRVAGDCHEARLERRESTDFSQKTLGEVFGAVWLAQAKEKLPTRVTESLRIVERKEEAVEAEKETRKAVDFFRKDRKAERRAE